MKIFLDTANIEDIKRGAAMGVLDGITTNPSLLAKEGVEYKERVLEIAKIVDGPISAECISETTEELIAEAFRIAEWHENIVVKIPLTEAGLAATNQITSEGIKVNTTLIFSPNQALLAAKAGSTYVSPFIGRLNDAGHDGMEVIREIADIFNQSELETEVLTASIRNPRDVIDAALSGSHIATIPPNVLFNMINHPLTDKGIDLFLADAKKYSPV
ncbi:MAG: fructose-6-phosphate aldolase [Dehalococcoidia bacterium]|jgi:transaldolase|nr:fructose-6-phosphate aldolase [Dehalococcoidia bacterium]|tara:strand:+ start:1846 stop:2493 length:648 start_codon:yes stop_codon:yes gene_type:complete